jgi:hypothetical protein
LAAWAAAAVQAPQGSSTGDCVPGTTLGGEDVSNADTRAETEAAVESPLCVARGQE